MGHGLGGRLGSQGIDEAVPSPRRSFRIVNASSTYWPPGGGTSPSGRAPMPLAKRVGCEDGQKLPPPVFYKLSNA